MNRILTYLFASVFIVLGASTAIASTAPNQEAIADKIVKQGFVDPKFYDKPSHLAEHKAALQWMNTLNNEQLTKLANDFYVTNKIGGPIEQDLLKAFKGGMYRGGKILRISMLLEFRLWSNVLSLVSLVQPAL